MCNTCGCSDPHEGISYRKPGDSREDHLHSYNHEHRHEHDHNSHEHGHTHEYSHSHDGGMTHHHHHTHPHDHDGDAHHHPHEEDHSHPVHLDVGADIMGRNNLLAERNRGYFEARSVFALNLVSSPGSGKTSLLERTLHDCSDSISFAVIEGDQQTMHDAERIAAHGVPVIQINTGNGCHLDAGMVNKAAKQLEIKDHSVLFIENVGNLVCPSLFDLGEARRVVVISVTEGDDKPLKYPNMFHTSHLCIINKTDLLPYVEFDVQRAIDCALRVNPGLSFIALSVKTGEGMDEWYNWLKKNMAQ